MDNIYFFFVIIPLIFELYMFVEAKETVASFKQQKKLRKQKEELSEELSKLDIINEFDELKREALNSKMKIINTSLGEGASENCFPVILVIFYAIWNLIGLFTSQWPLYILLLLLSVIFRNASRSVILMKIDSIVSSMLLIFIIINAYHLHIDFGEMLINLFKN